MIYFICPDFPQPSGGTRAIYFQVKLLTESGFPATVVHIQNGFQLTWHGIKVPTTSISQLQGLSALDVWVIPEGHLEAMRLRPDAQGLRVINVLNWLILPSLIQSQEQLKKYGVAMAISPSKYIQSYFEWTYQLPCRYLPASIDSDKFYDHPKQPGAVNIAYMSRKTDFGHMVRNTIIARRGGRQQVNFVAMDSLSEDQYAQTLHNTHIYLATGTAEGLNISVLEAMACGALVIGFDGAGGQDHMVGEGPDQNCILIEGGDLFSFAIAVDDAINQLLAHPNAFLDMLSNARHTAASYADVNDERNALTTFFTDLIQGQVS